MTNNTLPQSPVSVAEQIAFAIDQIEGIKMVGPPSVVRQAEAVLVSLRRLEACERDAARYRWLRDHKCNSLHLTRDGDHACNYTTAKEWIDDSPGWFADDPPEEIQRMKDANTIWTLQIYPNTPIGFNVWNCATLDAAIDSARSS